jgi:glycosyltransferase involved in cell wall biosynthesis
MLVSIIIASRDEEPDVLDATLARLLETTTAFDIDTIVVDDGSRVPVNCGSLPARVLRHPESVGTCGSRRAGALLAEGEVLVFLDAHMSFGPHWLEQLVLQAGPDSLLCSAFWSYNLQECHCWGADFEWNAVRDYGSNRYPGFGVRHRTDPPAHATVEVPMVIGACYAMRREAYQHLGGFCAHFRVWGLDEQDISARAWMAGMRVLCATHAKVGHLTRRAFPYRVQFEHLEFNQVVMLRSLFERATVDRLSPHFDPLPPLVETWLPGVDLTAWRKSIQRRRKLSDAEFFARFVPALADTAPKRRAGRARSG